jgi:hypothetical protein
MPFGNRRPDSVNHSLDDNVIYLTSRRFPAGSGDTRPLFGGSRFADERKRQAWAKFLIVWST